MEYQTNLEIGGPPVTPLALICTINVGSYKNQTGDEPQTQETQTNRGHHP